MKKQNDRNEKNTKGEYEERDKKNERKKNNSAGDGIIHSGLSPFHILHCLTLTFSV